MLQDYYEIYNEKENYTPLFEKLKKLVLFQGAISITPESWREIERLWRLLESQVRWFLWEAQKMEIYRESN